MSPPTKNQWKNIKLLPAEIAIMLEKLYDETSPERKKLEQGFKHIFSTEELIDGAYKQTGKDLGK